VKRNISEIGLLALAEMLVFVVPASAQRHFQLRPQIERPLRQAQPLIEQGKYNAAKSEVDKAAAVPNQSPEESTIISQMRDYLGMKSKDSTP
jgi:hypothetical protein